jgi:hypothetical protein
METNVSICWGAEAVSDHMTLCGCHCASSLWRTAGSAPATSIIFVRLALPVTSVTDWPWTPNAVATAARAVAVAWPSTARALTRTTRAPSCSPPTPGWLAPGRTRMVIRTIPVCPAPSDRRCPFRTPEPAAFAAGQLVTVADALTCWYVTVTYYIFCRLRSASRQRFIIPRRGSGCCLPAASRRDNAKTLVGQNCCYHYAPEIAIYLMVTIRRANIDRGSSPLIRISSDRCGFSYPQVSTVDIPTRASARGKYGQLVAVRNCA